MANAYLDAELGRVLEMVSAGYGRVSSRSFRAVPRSLRPRIDGVSAAIPIPRNTTENVSHGDKNPVGRSGEFRDEQN